MRLKIISSIVICVAVIVLPGRLFAGDTNDAKATTTVEKQTETTTLDDVSLESNFTFESNVRRALPLGKQSAAFNDFDYSHRFHLSGNWYLRMGVEYQRYDFGGSPFPLPDHLQGASATVSLQYVVKDFAAAAIDLHPGFYFQNDITGRSFDVPMDVYTSFKIYGDKVFGLAGVFEGQFFKPEVTPIGGIIWLINDKTRLEAIFPRPALIYTLNDDWELRATGEAGGYGFRMDRGIRTPNNYAGSVVMYDYFEAGAQVTYSHWKPVNISLGAGYDFDREFDFFRDGPGQKYKAAAAPYIKVSIEAKF